MCEGPADYVVPYLVIQSHQEVKGKHAEPDPEVQEIIQAIYHTCFEYRTWPETGDFRRGSSR